MLDQYGRARTCSDWHRRARICWIGMGGLEQVQTGIGGLEYVGRLSRTGLTG